MTPSKAAMRAAAKIGDRLESSGRYNDHDTAELIDAEFAALVAALTEIARPDRLLDAHEQTFGVHAARRMQAQANAALTDAEPRP